MTTKDHSGVSEEVEERIRSLHRMSPGDWQEVLAVLTDAALNVRITYDLVNALHKMDATSEALARKLVALTWVLVVFTAVLLVEPAIHLIQRLWPNELLPGFG